MRQDPIVIQPHDPHWAHDFAEQRAALQPVLADRLLAPIEHIGSTSVPGLPAKAIIDMVAVIHDHTAFSTALPALERIHWVHAPEPDDDAQRKWSLCFPDIEHRSHHLHVVEHDSSAWRDWLLFRDYLRTHADAGRRYAALKRQLAAADRADRVRYRSGKAPLIAELMDEARTWSELT